MCMVVNYRARVMCLVQIKKDLGTPDTFCRTGLRAQKVKLYSFIHSFIYSLTLNIPLLSAVGPGRS